MNERGQYKAKKHLLNRQLGEMARHSERMFAGHHVERYIDGYWVDHVGPMRFEDALAEIMSLTPEQAQAAYDAAIPVPLSDERIQEIVAYATKPTA